MNESVHRNRASASTLIPLSTKLNRIAMRARQSPSFKFKTLAHLIDVDLLRTSFWNLKTKASAGVDGITYSEYKENLELNLKSLWTRLKENRYRAQNLRRVYIEKEDGKKRPLSIPVLEDKIVQRAVVIVLNQIYENDFLPNSYGYRPRKNPHQAIKSIRTKISMGNISYVLDADIQDFFGTIDRKILMDILRKRIEDKAILRLISKWLRVGVLADGKILKSDQGVAQGSVISPLLSNIYLHEVLDLWIEKTVKPKIKGDIELTRFADDFVLCFQYWEDAKRVYEYLFKRFSRYGLTIHPKKTKLLRFGRFAEATIRRKKSGKRPETFDFLGFTFMCRTSRNGKYSVHVKTQRKKFARGMKRINEYCKKNRHKSVAEQSRHLRLMLTGHYNYYGLSSNAQSLVKVHRLTTKIWKYWLSKRSQKGRLNWIKFDRILKQYPLPKPKIMERPGGNQLSFSEFI